VIARTPHVVGHQLLFRRSGYSMVEGKRYTWKAAISCSRARLGIHNRLNAIRFTS